MIFFKEIALALDSEYLPQDFTNTFENILSEASVWEDETPDCTYIIWVWKDIYVDWDELKIMFDEIGQVRHSYCWVDDEEDVFKDVKCSDRYGIDEEFENILAIEARIVLPTQPILIG